MTFDFTDSGKIEYHSQKAEPWKVTVVDTGYSTITGGRIKRIKEHVGNETFFMTYGDGVCDLDMNELLKFHKSHGKIATMTAVNVGQQFGCLDLDADGSVTKFREKSNDDGAVINAGFMVLNPEIFDYLEDDTTVFEKKPLEKLASEGQLKAFLHKGFWKCMDTQREKEELERLWASGDAPWKVW